MNVLAYGAKRWELFPPARAHYAKTAAADRWFQGEAGGSSIMAAGSGAGLGTPLVCTQRAGDLLFVPSQWGHGTINERQSIGVAYEFSLEAFCME